MSGLFYNLFITPIEYIIELVYSTMSRVLWNDGLCIIFVSLAVQVMVFPLYKKADEIQDAERRRQKSLEKWSRHIKQTFRGNERYMMLTSYYRENNYKPYYALKGSISLILQVPFFIAAYNFLSGLDALNGSSFLFIRNLALPDALIHVGSFSINALPIAMTVINILSGMIYTKGFSVKEKAQLYSMAGLFLVILYNSPSGLVLYWTMNNLFSLLKNIVTKLFRNPLRFTGILSSVSGVLLFVFVSRRQLLDSSEKRFFVLALVAACFLPLVLSFRKKAGQPGKVKTVSEKESRETDRLFILGGVFLSVFLGAFIPLTVVSSSPLEFMSATLGPMNLVFQVLSISVGFFLVLAGTFYFLSGYRVKRFIAGLYWIACFAAAVDFLFFGKNWGTLNLMMVYDTITWTLETLARAQAVRNAIVVLCVSVVALLLFRFAGPVLRTVYIILIVSVTAFCIIYTVRVTRETSQIDSSAFDEIDNNQKVFTLSREGKNVVLIMLDRGIGGYTQFIFDEKPELRSVYEDFVYFPNTISYGGGTCYGSAPIFGGYEYTPDEMNKRNGESMVSKQNEALSVLPVLFSESGYDVTVCDPPLAGYRSAISDISIYDPYPGIKAYNLEGRFTNVSNMGYDSQTALKMQIRSMFFYSIMKSSPVALQLYIYNDGDYFSVFSSRMMPEGEFCDTYGMLNSLVRLTEVRDSGKNTFMMFNNELTHTPTVLHYPSYTYVSSDEVGYSSEPETRISADGQVLDLSSPRGRAHYHVNMAAMLLIGNWLEYLKQEGVYDNTRIIITSDHGEDLGQFDYLISAEGQDFERYYPVLIYKDFRDDGNSRRKTDRSFDFMTNGDACILAIDGLINNPVNPFTGKEINNNEKYAHPQLVTVSKTGADGNSAVLPVLPDEWYMVSDNMLNTENWVHVRLP